MIGTTRYLLQAEVNRQTALSTNIARAQQDISSGTRLQTASDDPLAAARVASITQTQSDTAVWTSNINIASTVQDQADSEMSTVATAVQRAHELMVQARNGTLSSTDRQAIAVELNGIADDIDAAATVTDSRGNPVFSTSSPLAIPISGNVTVIAAPSKAEAFDQVTTASGTMSLSAIVRQAATATAQNDMTTIATSVDATQAAVDHVSLIRGEIGSYGARLKTVSDQLANNTTQLAAEKSSLSDTDITNTVAKMQADMLSLQAAQAAFAKINQHNLFDYLG